MKRILLLIMLAWLNAAHGDDLASLVKSIGASRHLSVIREVRAGDVARVGKGFEYETSDQKTVARVLKFLETLPARDTWLRFHGEGAHPDANGVLELEFKKADGRKVSIVIYEPTALVFGQDQLFAIQGKDLATFYPMIGKAGVVPPWVFGSRPPETYRFDGTDDFHSRQRKVHDVQPVTRQPLFDNAPFFTLRAGDRLVKARMGAAPHDAKPEKAQEALQYYLESGGKYFQLRVDEEGEKLFLAKTPDSASACILFDWEMTLANAKVIRAMLPAEWFETFSREKYDEIIQATRAKFPKLITKETVLEPHLHEDDSLSGIPGLSFAEFDGLGFDRRQNEIYMYEIRIGPDTFFVRTTTLLQGPKPPGGKASSGPATPKGKKAEDGEAIEFQKMVEGIVHGGKAGGGTP